MKVPYFDLSRSHQRFIQQAQEAFDRILKSGAYVLGPALKDLEAEFAAYVGTKFALGVGSGTDALTFALKAVGIKKGDEVIVPSFKYRAHAISFLYACSLTSPLAKNLRYVKGIPKQGQWAWHTRCPQDLISVHRMYRRFI